MNKSPLPEYLIENDKKVKIENLKSDFIPLDQYKNAHQSLVITCHDVFVEYQGGILLVQRDNFPAKNILWPIGGRMLRGIATNESLKAKVKEECNLEIDGIKELGYSRTYFKTEPFGHGKGTDTIVLFFYAKGSGELKLNDLHSEPNIITAQDYTDKFKNKLHPCVRDYMNMIFGNNLMQE